MLWSSDAGWSSKFFSGEELDVHFPASLLQVQAIHTFPSQTRSQRVIFAVQHRVARDDVLVACRNTRPPHDAGKSSFVFLFLCVPLRRLHHISTLTSFLQEVLLNDVKVEEWNFKFGLAASLSAFHPTLLFVFAHIFFRNTFTFLFVTNAFPLAQFRHSRQHKQLAGT